MSETTEASRKRMKVAVESLQQYMTTYDKQLGYLDYGDDTFIHDVIYGIGIALDHAMYSEAGGYDLFKKRVCELLKEKEGQ